ncbi:acetyl-CoA carboxylase biotin carboxylase subunit family protein [Psychromicrobium sp. YIM B11713]|uniref:ATP-grasp domain-containing protein n=1 Tax=Psychromicrobium sp. YIM B11713 TaxID=3145233 RepID=UPI00374EDB58
MSKPAGKVLLFSRQPLRSRPLHDWLGSELTAETVLLTSPSSVEGADQATLRLYAHVEVVDEYQGWATELKAEELARRFGVRAIASTSEMDVLRAARLRERLGLPGQGVHSATAYRDKLVMRQILREAGIPIPNFSALDSTTDLLEFFDQTAGPVVVKPRLGFAAKAVSILREERDVEEFLKSEPASPLPFLPGQWMVEEYVSGAFHHVDGLMRGGTVLHSHPSRYSGGLAERVSENSHLGSLMLDPQDPDALALQRLAQHTVGALPPAPDTLAFHLEAWIRDDGQALVCEIASRAGGGPIVQGYQRSFGVQLARAGLLSQFGDEIHPPLGDALPEPVTGWLMFSGDGGVFDPPEGDCPVPGAELTLQLNRGEQTSRAADSGAAVATAVVSAADHAELALKLEELERWWEN